MTFKIDPTPTQRDALFQDLMRRNKYRREAQMPLINIATTYQSEIEIIRRQNFHDLLAPYIAQARSDLPTPSGLLGNMCAYHHARHIALSLFVRETGFDPMDIPIAESLPMRLIDELARGG